MTEGQQAFPWGELAESPECIEPAHGDSSSHNVAGQYLLDCFVNYTASDQLLDAAAPDSDKVIQYIRDHKDGS